MHKCMKCTMDTKGPCVCREAVVFKCVRCNDKLCLTTYGWPHPILSADDAHKSKATPFHRCNKHRAQGYPAMLLVDSYNCQVRWSRQFLTYMVHAM